MKQIRCKAKTKSGKRCARDAEAGTRFCWQHSNGGGGNGGNKLLEKFTTTIPVVASAAELVKIIIDIVGPLLSEGQYQRLRLLRSSAEPRQLQILLNRFLRSIDSRTFSRLLHNQRFMTSVYKIPGGIKALQNARSEKLRRKGLSKSPKKILSRKVAARGEKFVPRVNRTKEKRVPHITKIKKKRLFGTVSGRVN